MVGQQESKIESVFALPVLDTKHWMSGVLWDHRLLANRRHKVHSETGNHLSHSRLL